MTSRHTCRTPLSLAASLSVAVLVAAVLPPTMRAQPIAADLLLVGGTLHHGDGKPGVVGDVAVAGGRIVAVGTFQTGVVKQRIDCRGLIVAPGFIDLHNHSDAAALSPRTRSLANYLTQGCTTVVTGNCGSGPVDVGRYYDRLDELGIGLNVAHLLPHGSLRGEVMNSEDRKASSQELSRMAELTEAAMKDGAWGMSTGLIYVPGSFADTRELTALAGVVARHGGLYASHIRTEGTGLLDAVQEALTIGRDADIPVHISHFKSSGKESWGLVRTAVQMIRKERAAGRTVTADQYPYVASSTSLAATFIPAWARAGGDQKMLERFRGSEWERIQTAIRTKLTNTDQGERIQIARYRPDPSWAGRRLKAIADERGVDPLDLIVEVLTSDSDTKIVHFGINEEDVRHVMGQAWVATASDGSGKIPDGEVPHPRNYGTFPRKIGHYSVREGVVPLEQAIRSATGLPADILGLRDRGYLRAGMAADLAIWSERELIDQATFDDPHQFSQGIRYLLVNGTPAIWKGALTGALAGRPLRHR